MITAVQEPTSVAARVLDAMPQSYSPGLRDQACKVVEHQAVGIIADGVHVDLEAGSHSRFHVSGQLGRGQQQQAPVSWHVAVVFDKRRATTTQGAIG